MTHASIRIVRGVDDGPIRLGVGIEDADDLQEDLRQALARRASRKGGSLPEVR